MVWDRRLGITFLDLRAFLAIDGDGGFFLHKRKRMIIFLRVLFLYLMLPPLLTCHYDYTFSCTA